MRVSLSWLKQLVQVDESVEALEHRLSMAGFEVEEIDDLSANAQGVVVGHVIEREPHPNADKLSVCKVDVGDSEPLQIVCGAANVRAGIHVPVATVADEGVSLLRMIARLAVKFKVLVVLLIGVAGAVGAVGKLFTDSTSQDESNPSPDPARTSA